MRFLLLFIAIAVALSAKDQIIGTIQTPPDPVMVAFSRDGSTAYSVNDSGNSVSVIDTATMTVVDTIPLFGMNPIWVAVSPDGSQICVANSGSNNVSFIDTTTFAITTIPVGASPNFAAYNPDTSSGVFVYVTNEADVTVSVIDAASPFSVTTVPVLLNPAMVAFSADGSQAYVPDNGVNMLSIIDTSTLAVTNLTVGVSPSWVAFTPDGTQAYVANGSDNTVSVIDTAIPAVVNTILLAANPDAVPGIIAFLPDGSKAYVTSCTPTQGNTNTVSIIDTAGIGSLEATVTVGAGAVWVAVDPDGSQVYVIAYNTGTLAVINPSTDIVIQTIPIATTIQFVVFSPDGSYAYVTDDNMSTITIIGPSTSSTFSPATPGSLSVRQVMDNFAIVSELVNVVSWTGSPLLLYQIYRNGNLISTVGPGVLQYDDHDRIAGQTVNYSIIAYDAYGQISETATITFP